MNEELIERLKRDFFVTSSSEEAPNGKICLFLESPWKGRTPGVSGVKVYLQGINSLTGEQIPENKISCVFSTIETNYQSGTVDYCGEYYLHYDAILDTGEVIRDFKECSLIGLSCKAGQPYIRYTQINSIQGWTGITVEANCWRRCKGKLWARFSGHYQQIPSLTSNLMTCYLPVSHREFEVVCTDPALPAPQRN